MKFLVLVVIAAVYSSSVTAEVSLALLSKHHFFSQSK